MRSKLKRKSIIETPWIWSEMNLLLLSPAAAAFLTHGDTHSVEGVSNDNTVYPE